MLIHEVISQVDGATHVDEVCGNALSDGVVRAARHVGQAPWPARFLGLSGPQRLRGQGRPQAVAQRSRSDPWGWRGRPGNLRGANHTITDVTGRTKPAPGHRGGGPGALPLTTRGGRHCRRRTHGRSCGASRGGAPGWSGTRLRFSGSGRQAEVEAAAGVSMAIAISASGEW